MTATPRSTGMEQTAFEQWVNRYGQAWEARDAAAAARLFTEDATYQWTPFDKPLRGREAIAQAWAEATSTQEEVRFSYRVLGVDGDQGVAHWQSEFVRHATGTNVAIDGILVAELTQAGVCRRFREWWHVKELVASHL